MIRRLEETDLEIYRAIRFAALEAAPEAFGNTTANEATRSDDDRRDRLRTSIVLAAFAGGRPVGLAGLCPETGPKERHRAFVWGFFVDPSVRRQGLGRRLLASLLDAAPEPIEQVTLSVMANNGPAIALYESLGFVRYGHHPRAFRESWGYVDDLLMLKELIRAAKPADSQPASERVSRAGLAGGGAPKESNTKGHRR